MKLKERVMLRFVQVVIMKVVIHIFQLGPGELCIIEELGEHIESICRKYQLPVSDSERNKLRRLALGKALKEKNFLSTSTRTLYDYDLNEDWTDILENSRNNTLFDRARKYYRRNKDLILSDNTFRKIVHSWNKKYCKPPLPEFEVNGICNSILNHNNGGQD